MIIKKEILSSSLVKEIQRRISEGEFKSGEKLLPQDKLAAKFGVSRTVLREALKQLALMGLVEMEHGKGTFISSLRPSSMLISLSPLLLMDKISTFEFIEARLFIESAVAFLAAKKASPKDIQDLQELIRGMKENLGKGQKEDFFEKDLNFHLSIAKASKNRVLARFLQTTRDMLQQFIGNAFTMMPEMMNSAMNYHLKIFRSIKEHDCNNAKRHMEKHILHIERSLQKYYKDQLTDNDGGTV